VSRPKLIPLEQHWDLFRRHVAKPPQRVLMCFLEINVSRLRGLGRDHPSRLIDRLNLQLHEHLSHPSRQWFPANELSTRKD
jgi:hypothetical protein